MKYLVAFLLLFGQYSWSGEHDNQPLTGAWHLTGVEWRSAERTSALTDVQPGLFVFTPSHYALMWSPVNQPREPFKILAKPHRRGNHQGFSFSDF
jgi:hypothetical protein